MNRKDFLKTASVATGSFIITRDLFARNTGPVYGHNGLTYRMDNKWSKTEPSKVPVKDCHEMVEDRKKRLYFLPTKRIITFWCTTSQVSCCNPGDTSFQAHMD